MLFVSVFSSYHSAVAVLLPSSDRSPLFLSYRQRTMQWQTHKHKQPHTHVCVVNFGTAGTIKRSVFSIVNCHEKDTYGLCANACSAILRCWQVRTAYGVEENCSRKCGPQREASRLTVGDHFSWTRTKENTAKEMIWSRTCVLFSASVCNNTHKQLRSSAQLNLHISISFKFDRKTSLNTCFIPMFIQLLLHSYNVLAQLVRKF